MYSYYSIRGVWLFFKHNINGLYPQMTAHNDVFDEPAFLQQQFSLFP